MTASRWQLGAANALTLARRELAAAGSDVADLTDTNPTNAGLGDPRALEVVAEAAGRAYRYDPAPRGPLPAREALAARFGGSPDDYWLTASTSEAYSWLFALYGDPGQAVAIPAPGYPLVEPLARFANLATASYPLHYLHPYGWSYDLERFTSLAGRPDVAVAVVVDPGNPTGNYLTAAEAQAVALACAEGGVPLVVDQVFGPYGLGSGTDRELGPAAGPAFFLDGLSKLLCAPGLKLGWVRLEAAAGVKAGIAPLLDEIADTFLPASTVMSLALLGLLGLAEGVIATTRRRLSANLAHLQAALPEGARVRHAGGGWMALVDLPWEGEGDLALHLLQRGRVAVHPGWFYDLPDPDCVALSLLPEPGRFADGVARLVSAL